MKVLKSIGKEDLAQVYIAETEDGKRVEFVESLQPPFSKNEKLVVIVSTLFGCPVNCEMCDAGGDFKGLLSTDQIFFQLDHVIDRSFVGRKVTSKKFKVQFARVGEPSFNKNVIDVLRKMPTRYDAPGLIPSVSTIAPKRTEKFFEELLTVKKELYRNSFQLQFSIHSTDEKTRDRIIPIKKWNLKEIAKYGEKFFDNGGRKVTLNFILAENYFVDPAKLREIYSPDYFFIKMTPLNPTYRSFSKGLTALPIEEPELAHELRQLGFEVLYSVGELEENKIGSNCGQYIKAIEIMRTMA